MTHPILKSVINAIPDFAVRAAAHALEMRHWRAHSARVKTDAKNPDLPAIDRHVGYPAPSEHPIVMSAVNEADEVDFEVVDDGPTPEQLLRARKNELLAAVSRTEHGAIDAVIPPGKRRMLDMRETDIRAADAERATLLRNSEQGGGLLGAFRRATSADDIGAMMAEQRPAEDTAHLDQQASRRERISAIERIAAQAHHDIEDLTAETIGAWVMPNFS